MGNRKNANRAEGIVRGIGAFVLLLLLAVMVYALPQILKGKDTAVMMDTMIRILAGFTLLAGLVTAIGVIVWLKVLRGGKKRNDLP